MPKSVTLARPSAVDQHVLRLHVAVHEPVGVGARERAADLDRVGHRLGHRQPAEPPDAVLQRLALDVLEDDVGGAVVLAGVDHRDDVGVVELRHRAGLAPEALELVRVGGDVPVHQLDRHPALERGVEGAVDGRHPAGADLLLEPEAVAYEGADHCHLFCAVSMAVRVRYFTDPACSVSWATSRLRRLMVEFGADVRFTYVMGGLARDYEAARTRGLIEWLETRPSASGCRSTRGCGRRGRSAPPTRPAWR